MPKPTDPARVQVEGVPRFTLAERVVNLFRPRMIAERVASKYAAQYIDQQYRRLLSRSDFKAADQNRLNYNWTAGGSDINEMLKRELPLMRNRSRFLMRNNPHAIGAMNAYMNYIVGVGFDLQMEVYRMTEVEEDGQTIMEPVSLDSWNDYVEDVFRDWAENCTVHASDICPDSFHDVQDMTLRGVVEDGEVFVHLAVDPSRSGNPLVLEFVPPESLDTVVREWNGNPVIMGIEVEAASYRPVAYWVRSARADVPGSWGEKSIRVPAGDMLHIFPRLYSRQLRGFPLMAAVTQKFYDLDEYTEAELIGNKIAACFSVLISGPSGSTPGVLGAPSGAMPKDADGNTLSNISPGIIGNLPPETTVHVLSPQKPGATFDMFTKHHLKAAGAGVQRGGLSYQSMTRDTDGATYASGRLAQQMDFQGYRPFQNWLARKLCRPVLHRWMDLSVTQGVVTAPGYFATSPGPRFWRRHSWMPGGWSWGINPLQEVEASKRSIRSGITTLADECGYLGRDWKTQIRMHARVRKECRRFNVVLDTDPAVGNISRSGDAPAVDTALEQSQNTGT